MSRFVTKAAALTAALFPLAGGVAAAQSQAVDEKTGPVSFANIASVRIGGGGSLITETQRSPLLPGQSKLGTDRVTVPKDDGERSTFGGHYEIDLGRYDAAKDPYPPGIASRDHDVVAALQATTVPTASAETNYALRDTWQDGANPVDDTVLVLEGAKTSVDCTAPSKLTSTSAVSRLWVRQGGALGIVPMPGGNAGLELKNLRLGPPGDVANAAKSTTVSDVKLTRVTAFDQLIRQDGWRAGDFTAAAGWRAEITTHVKDAGGAALQDVVTTIVLGGVSCSVPKGFVAKAANTTGGGTGATQPAVPTQVPAGYLGAAAPDTGNDGSRVPLGIGLLFGGVFFAAVALLLGKRRKSGTD